MMARHFRPCDSGTSVFLYRDPVDFRKQSAGLAAIVEQELGCNPFDGSLYAFTNRQRNKIKCLFWENNASSYIINHSPKKNFTGQSEKRRWFRSVCNR